jgi:hypothetical protein
MLTVRLPRLLFSAYQYLHEEQEVQVTEQQLRAVKLAIWATDDQLEQILERVEQAICGTEQHETCDTPWAVTSSLVRDLPRRERRTWERGYAP